MIELAKIVKCIPSQSSSFNAKFEHTTVNSTNISRNCFILTGNYLTY